MSEVEYKRIPTYFTFDVNNIYRASKKTLDPRCTCKANVVQPYIYPVPMTPQKYTPAKKCCVIS